MDLGHANQDPKKKAGGALVAEPSPPRFRADHLKVIILTREDPQPYPLGIGINR